MIFVLVPLDNLISFLNSMQDFGVVTFEPAVLNAAPLNKASLPTRCDLYNKEKSDEHRRLSLATAPAYLQNMRINHNEGK